VREDVKESAFRCPTLTRQRCRRLDILGADLLRGPQSGRTLPASRAYSVALARRSAFVLYFDTETQTPSHRSDAVPRRSGDRVAARVRKPRHDGTAVMRDAVPFRLDKIPA
jgi:hypothetical protein